MKVIGAGLPRTATTTQKLALEMLGLGPCYHMRDLMENFEEHLPLWEQARDGRADWERIFDGYQSEVDWPGSFFWRELMDVYPDAKVLLSVRDAEGWERSMRDTIWSIYFGDSVMHHMARARYQVDPQWRRWYDLMVSMCWTGRGAFAGSYAEREQLMDAMERWNDEVTTTVPAERLLVWHPKDGWEPLCEFLDVTVPDEPVPNVNDTEAFKQGIIGGAVQSVQQWWDREQAAVA
jgi:hypothetical protein